MVLESCSSQYVQGGVCTSNEIIPVNQGVQLYPPSRNMLNTAKVIYSRYSRTMLQADFLLTC